MTEVPGDLAERVYAYRSFEHHKRLTFAIIVAIAKAMNRPLNIVDVSCGPGVLAGILCQELGGAVASLLLLDYEESFLRLAREHLAPLDVPLQTAAFDLNNPATFPKVQGADLIVSTNALFHAREDSLPHIYGWAFSALAANGLLVNHQTFGLNSSDGDRLYAGPLQSLTEKAVLDPLDRELNRRSHLDAKRFASTNPVGSEGAYTGLPLPAERHLEALSACGFIAEEVWRLGRSGMVVGMKP